MSTYLQEVASRLVAFDTVSSKSNVAAVEYIGSHLADHGFSVALHRTDVSGVPKANLVATIGPPEPNGLIISGHVDVVPFTGQPGWTREPLQLEMTDAYVYGRGTSDMKVFLAQCVEAARRIDRSTLKQPLVFLFTADEEVGCLGAARLLPVLPEFFRDIPQPRQAWIGEPTSYRIGYTHKSIIVFSITIQGKGGHSSVPEQGVNAIAVAGKVIDTIGQYQAELRTQQSTTFIHEFPESPYTTLNFGMIRGGTASNMIAEECTIQVSYRSLPDVDPLLVHREIARRVQRIDPRDYGSPQHQATIVINDAFVVPPLLSPRDTPLEQTLATTLKQKSSGGVPFTTDGCQFSQAGIASIICGPGDLDQAHQPNESIRREAFEQGTEVILTVVRELCGATEQRSS